MTIPVTGATGSVGGAVFAMLRAAGVHVRGGSRRPGSAGLPTGTAVAFDLDDAATVGPALQEVDRVFLYAGTNDLGPFLQAAHAAGDPHIVLLSSASVVESGADTNAIAQHHRSLEEAITASGLPATFLRPGDFATNTLNWVRSVRQTGSVQLPHADARLAPIHELDIADVAVAALTRSELTGQAPVLTGPANVTQREQVAEIGRALGRSIQVEELTPEQAREQMATYLPAPVVQSLLTFLASRVDTPSGLTDQVATITGHPARSFETWAAGHVDAFR